MCKWDDTVLVKVKISADLDRTGKVHWRSKAIDSCIAPIVRVLQESGIDMRGSCCGHGEFPGTIHLQDGRLLLIVNADKYWSNDKKYIKSLQDCICG